MRYFDSGVLVKLYHQEPNSAVAVAHVQAASHPITLTPLHVVEIRSALRLMEGRGEISPSDYQQSLAAFNQDRTAGVYVEPTVDWNDVFQRTEHLSAAHTATTRCRSLDVIHVALALALGANELCSFDQRQSAMARLVGLKVIT